MPTNALRLTNITLNDHRSTTERDTKYPVKGLAFMNNTLCVAFCLTNYGPHFMFCTFGTSEIMVF